MSLWHCEDIDMTQKKLVGCYTIILYDTLMSCISCLIYSRYGWIAGHCAPSVCQVFVV